MGEFVNDVNGQSKNKGIDRRAQRFAEKTIFLYVGSGRAGSEPNKTLCFFAVNIF